MIPRFDLCRFTGCDLDGLQDVTGWSLAIEWVGFILELNFGKARHG